VLGGLGKVLGRPIQTLYPCDPKYRQNFSGKKISERLLPMVIYIFYQNLSSEDYKEVTATPAAKKILPFPPSQPASP